MSWRKVLALGGVGSAIAIGCTVTVTDGSGDAGFGDETGGSSNKDAGTGGKATGGSGGKATGGTSTGGKGGAGGASTGGKGGAGTGGAGMPDAATVCMPDKNAPCDYCIETKCCSEWLDCVNDTDCEDEFACVQKCLIGDDAGVINSLEDCAGMCKHDPVGVSSATNGLLICMQAMGDSSTTQNCTNECFGREL